MSSFPYLRVVSNKEGGNQQNKFRDYRSEQSASSGVRMNGRFVIVSLLFKYGEVEKLSSRSDSGIGTGPVLKRKICHAANTSTKTQQAIKKHRL